MKVLLLMLLPIVGMAQRDLGVYGQVGSETFYIRNLAVSAGLRYKELRVGYYYQSATVPYEGLYVRKGLFTEIGMLNVDKIAYFSVGARFINTNDKFVSVAPHFTMAFRYKFVEIPFMLTSFKGYGTASVNIRFLF